MIASISPSFLKGRLLAPASKSAMQRACAAALVRGGKTVLINPGNSDDDKAAMDIIYQLGADVNKDSARVTIHSEGLKPRSNRLNCGESGLSIRLFTSLAAVSDSEFIIEGEGSLKRRPLNFFDEVLPQLGVRCNSNDGMLPLQLRGPLQPRSITIDGSLSSQFLTGLLFAYSAAGARDVTIVAENLNSKPYIDLTLQIMNDFGLSIPAESTLGAYTFTGDTRPGSEVPEFVYTVEGDWSGAAFLLVAAAIGGDAAIEGLDVFSTQADRAILQALMQAGAQMSIEPQKIEVRKAPLRPFHFDARHCPDLFPPLVALASYCDGKSVIEGVNRLAHKESNRALTLQEELGKLGITIQLQDDLMIITGGPVRGATVSSHGDHRIAMACAVAALGAKGEVTIEGAGAVNKSYPAFWDHLASAGVAVSLNNI